LLLLLPLLPLPVGFVQVLPVLLTGLLLLLLLLPPSDVQLVMTKPATLRTMRHCLSRDAQPSATNLACFSTDSISRYDSGATTSCRLLLLPLLLPVSFVLLLLLLLSGNFLLLGLLLQGFKLSAAAAS
jgi:hypothetical protein